MSGLHDGRAHGAILGSQKRHSSQVGPSPSQGIPAILGTLVLIVIGASPTVVRAVGGVLGDPGRELQL